MDTKNLFQLADAAKNCGDYELANQIFACLAFQAITGDPGANNVWIGYEQDPSREDIVENLADPDCAGYYDLPFLFDGDGNYVCIPLPLVSRHFCNHVVWRCQAWSDREQGDHSRKHWRLSHSDDNRQTASRDLWRRFRIECAPQYIQIATNIILRQFTEEPIAEPVTGEELRYLGPETLAKLKDPILEFEEYEEEFA
jgi:hypothetical protein